MMSYDCNLIVSYLSKKALLTRQSKSSKSIYYSLKGFCIRYSDHWTNHPRLGYLQVVRKSKEVWILKPGDTEYTLFSERSAYYYLRRLIKESTQTSKGCKFGRSSEKYRKWKNKDKETRRVKRYLKGLSGMSKEAFKNYRLEKHDSLIYVDKYLP